MSDWYQRLRSIAGFAMVDGSDSQHPNFGPTQDVSTLWAAIRALEEKFEAQNVTIATDVRLILTQLEHLTVAAAPQQPPPHFRAGDAAILPPLVSPHYPLHLRTSDITDPPPFPATHHQFLPPNRFGAAPPPLFCTIRHQLRDPVRPVEFPPRFEPHRDFPRTPRTDSTDSSTDDEEFYRLNARTNIYETEDQQVARFIGGLRDPIQDQFSLHPVLKLYEAVSLAHRAEEQLLRTSSRQPFSRRHSNHYSLEKNRSSPALNTTANTSLPSPTPPPPPHDRDKAVVAPSPPPNPYTKPLPPKCFRCGVPELPSTKA
ncbi:hypothetical protein TIFTF001_033681 [Ficus carica]|uniref:Uncharacterized protein n=1 Tax=Ficus carica TaxID=3494 RepID=A0AA88J880_FICCA|nr:hypothetical protein TIFTF001_033681 [Ficus carica]